MALLVLLRAATNQENECVERNNYSGFSELITLKRKAECSNEHCAFSMPPNLGAR
jgi:hypothetical protein